MNELLKRFLVTINFALGAFLEAALFRLGLGVLIPFITLILFILLLVAIFIAYSLNLVFNF